LGRILIQRPTSQQTREFERSLTVAAQFGAATVLQHTSRDRDGACLVSLWLCQDAPLLIIRSLKLGTRFADSASLRRRQFRARLFRGCCRRPVRHYLEMLGKEARRAIWTIGVVLVIGAVGFTILLLCPDRLDISYRGRRLSEHLVIAAATGTQAQGRNIRESQEAITALGTNCVPLLARWLQTETPAWRLKLGKSLWARGIASTQFPPEEKGVIACHAIGLLKGNALMLGPGLATAATNSSMAVAHLACLTLHLQVFTWSVGFFTSDSQPSLASAVERSVKTLEAQVRQPSAHPSLKETLALMRNTQIYLTRTPPSP